MSASELLNLFLDAPTAENFKNIKDNPWMLTRAFQKNEELAKKYFKFEEWLKVHDRLVDLTEDEKSKVKDLLKSSVSSFPEAIKYYHTLNYEDRTAWQKDFISRATTVKDCQYAMSLVNKEHREEIVKKMRRIAITDEDKKIAYSYVI